MKRLLTSLAGSETWFAALRSRRARTYDSAPRYAEIAFVDRRRLLSLKRQISAAQSFALTELTEELVAIGTPVPEELVVALAERIERGACITTGAIASLVAASRNRRLYETAREHVLRDTWAVITLLRGNIPDPAIEKRLRDELYQVFRSSDDPRRSEILRALAEHGSTDCLDDLETIEYDFTPRLQTAKLAADITASERIGPQDHRQDLLQAITHGADIAFGEKLQIAIKSVRERGKPPANEWGTPAPTDDPFALARSYIQKAEQHVAGQDYGAALNYCRKALEAVLKSVIKGLALTVKKDESVDKLELPALIAVVIPQLNVPKDIRMKIEAVQRDSTYGSHDQGVVPDEILTAGIAQATIDKYRQIEAHLAKVMSGSA